MTFRSRSLLLAAVGLWMAQPLPGQEPPPILVAPGSPVEMPAKPTDNQMMADAIAGQLRQSARLTQYMIHVSCQDGMVELSGAVADEVQRQEALRIVRGMSGVKRVMDNMVMGVLMPVQAKQAEPVPPPAKTLPPPMLNGGHGGPPHGGPMEPMPIYQHGPVSPYDLNPPRMPPHAWPTYAPYNNVSRNAYPTHYPYQSWPFIGPFYPFPKVPLGWRSVKLEWEDGHWWYMKTATQHDWWRIRYW